MHVGWREAQRHLNMSLGLLSSPEHYFGVTDVSVGIDQVSIQLKRALAFPDAVSGTIGMDSHNT